MNIDSFQKININDRERFLACLGSRYCNSESSFATMYMWQHYYDVKYCLDNDIIYSIYCSDDGVYSSFMPYGEKRNSVDTVKKLIDLYKNLDSPLQIRLCTEDFVDFLDKSGEFKFSVTETRNSFDYVYRTEDLINLNGKKYHSKKNHINTFNKKYEYDYVRYNPSMKNECLDFCKKVLSQHYSDNKTAYDAEFFSLSKTFDSLSEMGLKCAMLRIGDRIIALTVGERLSSDYALIHIEKADYEYRTAYSVINNLFLKNEFSDTKYVNREEDMGIEGLRIAKKSYNPCHMIKKYTVRIENGVHI